MKNILIGVVVIAILAVGGYFVYTNYMNVTPQNGNATTTPQVQAVDVTIGTGTQATPGSIVSVLYEGKFTNGTVFDSSAANGGQPLRFQLGDPRLIPGFQLGVNGMKVGGERNITVPSELAYGAEDFKHPETGAVIIPANSTLIFNVKLVNVEPAPTSTATTTGQ